jgi:hypothetical protein
VGSTTQCSPVEIAVSGLNQACDGAKPVPAIKTMQERSFAIARYSEDAAHAVAATPVRSAVEVPIGALNQSA